jgi:glycerol-3-phosphate acyltransferase PlsY
VAVLKWVAILLVSYLIGSIPIAYLAGAYLKGIDIRKFGSGNVGTTNAFRMLGTGPALLVLAGDVFKGVVATAMGLAGGGPWLGLLAALAVLAGHNWSLFLRFKGGRGAATGAGILLILAPKVLLLVLLIFVGITILTRYVSLGSILAAASAPILMIAFREPFIYIILTFIAAAIVIFRHRTNIRRLLRGTELRFGDRP